MTSRVRVTPTSIHIEVLTQSNTADAALRARRQLIRLSELLKNDFALAQSAAAKASNLGRCVLIETHASKRMGVEVNGIEPMTPCLQSRCSPS